MNAKEYFKVFLELANWCIVRITLQLLVMQISRNCPLRGLKNRETQRQPFLRNRGLIQNYIFAKLQI
jgi:hypothetical protein